MKHTFGKLALAALVLGAPASLACSWIPPEEASMTQELQSIALASMSSDPTKAEVEIEPVAQSYKVEETSSTGMCPDAVHFSGQYAISYDVQNGLDSVGECRVIVTVTKTVPWTSQPKVSYEVENLHLPRCN